MVTGPEALLSGCFCVCVAYVCVIYLNLHSGSIRAIKACAVDNREESIQIGGLVAGQGDSIS